MQRKLSYLDQIFGKDATVLSEWIEEVKGDAYARQSLAADVLLTLENHALRIERELEKISHWSAGYKPSVDRRRSDLENQLERARANQREHKLSLWRDMEELRKELRLLVREYRKARRKQDLLQSGETRWNE